MQVTIQEIRKLREILDANRIEHEALVTQTKILREHCQEVRELCRNTSSQMSLVLQR